MGPRNQAEVKTMIMTIPNPTCRATAAFFAAALFLAACQGPDDRPAGGSSAVDGKTTVQDSGHSNYCNGPCYGFQHRRSGPGPH